MERSGDSFSITSPMNKSEQRKASKHETGVDLISDLPDPILHLILSGLPSTEELIRTSILSKRWRCLWTSVPSLDLYCGPGRNHNFKEFVYWILLNRSVDLDSFRLTCWDCYSMLTLERWIHATVVRNVKKLELNYTPKETSGDMVMPHCLVTCASLEVLRLTLYERRLILPSFPGFPALRVLQFTRVELFDDDLVNKFLESCPLLEDLTFDDCIVDKLDLLYISCPKLKKLSFSFTENEELCGCLKLSCPKLVFLELSGAVASSYIFECLYSLKEVAVHHDSDTRDDLFDTISRSFHGVSHVESLRTDLSFLSKAPDLALPNLKTLDLYTMNDDMRVKEHLIQVLKCCPELESLKLTVECFLIHYPQEHDETEYPKLDEAKTERRLTRDVKWIEFFKFNGQKPKLDISWDEFDSGWKHLYAMWGNAAK